MDKRRTAEQSDPGSTAGVPAASDPAAALASVVALRRLADRLERAAVRRALADGWTWAQIAEALDVTPQAAHKRLAERDRPEEDR